MNLDELPPLLTVKEVSDLLRIGINQAYTACDSGEIPAVRFGRTWRIPRPALLEMLGVDSHNGDAPDADDVEGDEAASTATVQGLHDEPYQPSA